MTTETNNVDFKHSMVSTISNHMKVNSLPYHAAKKQVETFIYNNTVHKILDDVIIDVFVNPETGRLYRYHVVSTMASVRSIRFVN